MIQPTVGRVVHITPQGHPENAQKHAALIVFVHNDRTINVVVFSHLGLPYGIERLPLIQDGDPIPADGPYAEWMAYQKGPAAKTEAAEAALNTAGPTLAEALTAGSIGGGDASSASTTDGAASTDGSATSSNTAAEADGATIGAVGTSEA